MRVTGERDCIVLLSNVEGNRWLTRIADRLPGVRTTTPSIANGLTAPNSLTNLPGLINNVLQAPTPNTTVATRTPQRSPRAAISP